MIKKFFNSMAGKVAVGVTVATVFMIPVVLIGVAFVKSKLHKPAATN